MQFIDNAPLYRIVRVTGPQHNLLGIELSADPLSRAPEVEILNRDTEASGQLAAADVAREVILGVNQASLECGRQHYVGKIQYITTDSLPVTIYRELAKEIIYRVCGNK
jgi:hypothetical protein